MKTKQQQDIELYGETIEAMKERCGYYRYDKIDYLGVNRYVMEIISDAQEMFMRGETKAAHQLMNKAKWFISEVTQYLKKIDTTILEINQHFHSNCADHMHCNCRDYVRDGFNAIN